LNKYKRFALSFILIEIAVLIIAVIITGDGSKGENTKQYNVDISRIAGRMEKGETIEDINLEEYENVISADKYDDSVIYNYEYVIKKVNGELYCFQYTDKQNDSRVIILIILLAGIILANIILFIYIGRKILMPFNSMSKLTTELAKGNLSTPVKQEKSKYFSKFLWGIDMLRETLEDNKKKELELVKEKKTLMLSLSHDIKTPLSAIELYSKALQRELYESAEERKAAYEGISSNVSEIKRYVDEITKASRDEFLMLETNNTEVYVSHLFNNIKEFYCEKMKCLHIDFDVEQSADCLIIGDEDRLTEVMQNCIENAIKYGDGLKIRISSEEDENCKLITVSNTGCTLSKEELTHIFDSFYRGSNSEKEEGSGLGLYICKVLMHKMDGDIFAGIEGNEFRISLVVRKVI